MNSVQGELHSAAGEGLFLFSSAADAASTLLESHAGKVRLVYLDPPFGTGDTFMVKTGKGRAHKIQAYSDRLGRDEYLGMMEDALRLAYELMSEDASIYLHIDYRMAAHLKLLMDRVFGGKNFLNEIIWSYKSGGRATRYYSRKHDNILFYKKGRTHYFNAAAIGEKRGVRRRNNMKRTVDAEGKVTYSIRSGGKLYTYSEDSLIYPSDVWQDIPHLQQRDPERTGYSTQKPEALLKRIILASSEQGDTVLDLFCGSGTTAAAAAKLGRRWIATDPSPASLMTMRSRLLSARPMGMLDAPGSMRIRYIAKPPQFTPSIDVVREDGGFVVTPKQYLSYMAAGRVEDGCFVPSAFDLAPMQGMPVHIKGDRLTLQLSDAYGALAISEYSAY